MASLIHELVIGSRKADGSVNAGGRVYLTRPGTDTRVTGYQDRDLLATISLSNGGILLGADGKRAIYITEPATVREETSDGTAIATYTALTDVNAKLVEVENAGFTGTLADGTQGSGGRTYLNTILTAAKTSLNGLDFQYLQSSAATKRPIHEWMTEVHMSVVNFGAVGDGVADDTTAIQNTINACAAAGGGIVFFPPGTYKTSAALTCSVVGVSLVGAGSQTTIIRQSSTTANCISWSSSAGSCRFTGLTIDASTTSTGVGISATSGSGYRIDDVKIDGFRTGISGAGLKDSYFSQVYITGDSNTAWIGITAPLTNSVLSGVLLDNPTGDGTCIVVSGTLNGPTVLIGCASISDSAIGVDVTSTADVTLIGCTMFGSTAGLRLATTTTRVRHFNCSFGPIDDNRTGTSLFNYALTTTTSVTPNPDYPVTRIVQSTGSTTVTIDPPVDGATGDRHTILCVNSSGGSVTWTFNAAWHTSAAVNPSTGNRVAVTFVYDAIADIWSEESRATSAN